MSIRHLLMGISAFACIVPAAPALAQDGTRIIIRRPLNTAPAIGTPPVVPSTPSQSASCGGANGATLAGAPAPGSLCLSGTASAVSMTVNSYSWSCTEGASMASCAATRVPPANGSCGPASGGSSVAAPSSSLCSGGIATAVASNPSTFDWSCVGASGGGTATCSSNRVYAVNGSCGAANGGATTGAPSSGLCGAGDPTSVSTVPANMISGANAYTWSCTGQNGGGMASCASNAQVAGTCGSANNTNRSTAPSGAEQCSGGGATAVSTGTTSYTWSCTGPYGGPTTSCSATRPANGVCGSDNGGTFVSSPSASNCSLGASSGMSTGSSTYNWSCLGVNGGSATACSANRSGTCGAAAGTTSVSAPSSSLCGIGSSSAVATNASTFDWSCTNGTGTQSCSANRAVAVTGTCGSAQAQSYASAPTTGLCSSGSTAGVSTNATTFDWICAGANGGGSNSCFANRQLPGSCGSANGGSQSSAPVTGLCSTGMSTSVVTGPSTYTWSCMGPYGGATASCGSNRIANGVCGSDNGGTFASAPTTANCSLGASSGVSTNASTYTWSCGGVNGGSPTACSANRPGACGASNGTSTNTPPSSSLCNIGSSSAVATNPSTYDWSCTNGTGSASCSANRLVPFTGTCGSSHTQSYASAPATGLCAVGANSAVATNAATYDWICNGGNGGGSNSCYANRSLPGSCGSANGVTTPTAPWSNALPLCSSSAAAINGTNNGTTWGWTCPGTNGGSAVSCSAPYSYNGTCGSGAGVASVNAPWTTGVELCSSAGAANSGANNGTNWTWVCPGQNGGSSPTCTAPVRTNGACGSANGGATTGAPAAAGLCSAGAASGVTTNASASTSGANAYSWSCTGQSGGSVASCSSNRILPGACGSAQATNRTTAPTPGAETCSAGGTASLATNATTYNWQCTGPYGGAATSCYANRALPGVCGSSHTATTASAPSGAGACSSGALNSASTQPTQFWWACQGINGGANTSCYALRSPTCGAANGVSTTTAPSSSLCSIGSASAVATGPSSYQWNCYNGSGTAACSAPRLIPVTGVCGPTHATTSGTGSPPTSGLCNAGIQSAVVTSPTTYQWNCNGQNGGGTVGCYQNRQPFTSCGGGTEIGYHYRDTRGSNYGTGSLADGRDCFTDGGNCIVATRYAYEIDYGGWVEREEVYEESCMAGATLGYGPGMFNAGDGMYCPLTGPGNNCSF